MVAKKTDSLKESQIKTIIEQTAKKLLSFLGEKDFQLQVEKGEEEWWVKIKATQPALLIGYRGKGLEALQLVLKLMVARQTDQWFPLVVDVDDYRAKQQERILALATQAAQQAKAAGQAVSLPPMSPFERRLVHLAFQKDKEVETASVGEGDQRRVVIEPKKQ